MLGMGSRALSLASPRILLSSFLFLGLISGQGGRGTLAYFTSSTNSGASVFTAGTVDIAGSNTKISSTNGTGSGTTNLSFTTGGSPANGNGADCALSGFSGTFLDSQLMTPGVYCSGKLTISNSSTVDSYVRIRLVRTGGSTTASTADYKQNERLLFSMRELTNPTTGTCTAANYKPGSLNTANTSAVTLGDGSTTLDSINIGTSGSTKLNVNGNAGTNTPGESDMTSGRFANLIGTNVVDANTTDLQAGATSPSMSAGTDRAFCVMFYWPDDALGLANGNSGGDNDSVGGTNTYVINIVGAQKSGR